MVFRTWMKCIKWNPLNIVWTRRLMFKADKVAHATQGAVNVVGMCLAVCEDFGSTAEKPLGLSFRNIPGKHVWWKAITSSGDGESRSCQSQTHSQYLYLFPTSLVPLFISGHSRLLCTSKRDKNKKCWNSHEVILMTSSGGVTDCSVFQPRPPALLLCFSTHVE